MKQIANKVEALLFSSGRSMSIEEISTLLNILPEETAKSLEELKKKYENNETLDLIQEGDHWKLNVKEEYIQIASKVVEHAEISKTLMETLAVIAFKYPIKQADLIKIRTNKAYDHLMTLEEMGYITRQKYGRTKLIKLTQKFFDYFDLPREKLKEKFKDFQSLAVAIEEKEDIIEKMKKEKSPKEKTEIIKEPEVDLVDEKGHKVKLQVFDEPEVFEEEKEKKEEIEVFDEKDKLDGLEIIEEPEEIEKKIDESKPEEDITEEKIDNESVEEASPDFIENLRRKKKQAEFDKEIDKRVDALLHPPKQEKDDDEEPEDEPKDLLEAPDEEEKEQ